MDEWMVAPKVALMAERLDGMMAASMVATKAAERAAWRVELTVARMGETWVAEKGVLMAAKWVAK